MTGETFELGAAWREVENARQRGEQADVAMALTVLGQVLAEADRRGESERALQQAVEATRDPRDFIAQAHMLVARSVVLEAKGELQRALNARIRAGELFFAGLCADEPTTEALRRFQSDPDPSEDEPHGRIR